MTHLCRSLALGCLLVVAVAKSAEALPLGLVIVLGLIELAIITSTRRSPKITLSAGAAAKVPTVRRCSTSTNAAERAVNV